MSGVYAHSRLLIHHNNIFVLVHNVDWNILGRECNLVARKCQTHRDMVERLYLIRCFLRFFVYKNTSIVYGILDTVARAIFDMRSEELIQAHHRLSLIDSYGVMLVQAVFIGFLVRKETAWHNTHARLLVITLEIDLDILV